MNGVRPGGAKKSMKVKKQGQARKCPGSREKEQGGQEIGRP